MNKQKPSQNQSIAKFISDVTNKNYSSADKELASIIENKLMNRINNFKNLKIFKNHERN